ncbi:MAG: hypothetical protein HYV63_29885 [Candidatus Schekmanbacteria bacterium]|nr:hypothetical protein [Candidatus Schekmanbacteria bacterium]
MADEIGLQHGHDSGAKEVQAPRSIGALRFALALLLPLGCFGLQWMLWGALPPYV